MLKKDRWWKSNPLFLFITTLLKSTDTKKKEQKTNTQTHDGECKYSPDTINFATVAVNFIPAPVHSLCSRIDALSTSHKLWVGCHALHTSVPCTQNARFFFSQKNILVPGLVCLFFCISLLFLSSLVCILSSYWVMHQYFNYVYYDHVVPQLLYSIVNSHCCFLMSCCLSFFFIIIVIVYDCLIMVLFLNIRALFYDLCIAIVMILNVSFIIMLLNCYCIVLPIFITLIVGRIIWFVWFCLFISNICHCFLMGCIISFIHITNNIISFVCCHHVATQHSHYVTSALTMTQSL